MPKKTPDPEEGADKTIREMISEDTSAAEIPTVAEEETPLKEVEIDTSALKEEVKREVTPEVSEKVSREVVDKIINSLTGKSAEERREEYQFPWEKESRNPVDYTEWAKETAKYVDWQNQKRGEVELRRIEQANQSIEDNKASWNQFWDSEFDDLRNEGLIPKVENKDDKEDPGVKAQREIEMLAYQAMNGGQLKLASMKLAFYSFYQGKNRQLPGAEAPISLGTPAAGSKPGEQISEEELRSKSLRELVAERYATR